jgi:2-C-methyl-D-erythritol 4-phosphate cytidylyltransferase
VKVTAIIPAAGSGKRINAKKQFMEINGQPVLSVTVSVFDKCQSIDDVIVVAAKEDIELTKTLLKDNKKVKSVVEGGAERQDSVYNGLKAVVQDSDDDIVVIHDAARPLVTKEIIAKAIMEVKVSNAVIVGVPAKDTIKTVSSDNVVLGTLDRGSIWQVQTPQVFRASVIKEAYERAQKIRYRATDDSKLVERMGIPVKMVMGSYENIKITTIEDVAVAEAVLKGRGK